MSIDQQTTELLAILAAVVGLSVAYAKVFAQYQYQISEWVIVAAGITKKTKGLVNLGVGVVLALALSALAAMETGEWGIIAVGALAGVLASVEAAKVHDGQVPAEAEKPTTLVTQGQVRR